MFTVSHDRFFLDRVGQKLLVLGVSRLGKQEIGGYEFMEGGDNIFSRYSNIIAERRTQFETDSDQGGYAGGKPKRAKSADKKRQAAPEELKRFNRFTVTEIEEMIMQFEEDIMCMQEQFGNENIYRDPEKYEKLTTEMEAAKNRA